MDSVEQGSLYKRALLENLVRGAGRLAGKTSASAKLLRGKLSNNYVMDAVRKARPQYATGVTDTGNTMHGSVFKVLEENGAVGASTIRKGFDKVRTLVEDVDTGLGAMAVGKKSLETGKGLRHDMFTFHKRNYVSGGKLGNNPFGDYSTSYQASRPSITAPLEGVSAIAVPTLAMFKGMEIQNGQPLINQPKQTQVQQPIQ